MKNIYKISPNNTIWQKSLLNNYLQFFRNQLGVKVASLDLCFRVYTFFPLDDQRILLIVLTIIIQNLRGLTLLFTWDIFNTNSEIKKYIGSKR